MYASIRQSDGLILQYGDSIGTIAGATNYNLDALTTNALLAVPDKNGGITLTNILANNDNTVQGSLTVLQLPAAQPLYTGASWLVTAEYKAAQNDLATNAQTALDWLDNLIANWPIMTSAQQLASVQDVVRITRRVIRYLKAIA